MSIKPLTVLKDLGAPPGSTVPLPWRCIYSCVRPILGQITVVNDIFKNVKSSQIPCGKSSRSLWLYMLHPCQWFYIWLHCNTECTVFLCGWWQWWGSRVEMGFSCSCLSLTLAQQWINSFRVAEFSPSTCHTAGFPPLLLSWCERKRQRLILNDSLHLYHVTPFNGLC